MIKKFFSTLLITAMICAPMSLSAQITIGSGAPPSEWSLLYLDASELPKALHNARLDSLQRESLVPSGTNNKPAGGVMIFNTTNNCLEFWNGERWVSLCVGRLPETPSTPPTPSSYVHVTALVRVIYDFQPLSMEAWHTGDGTPTAWQWQVSADNENWENLTNVPGAATAYATLPANFIHRENRASFNNVENLHRLFFRNVITSANGETTTQTANNTLEVIFIRTTDWRTDNLLNGFGRHYGILYAELSRGAQTNPATGNTFRVALTNLGATDANGGLGYLFQWGRRADGHQVIDWHNHPVTRATTFTSGAGNTSETITRGSILSTGWNTEGQPATPTANFITTATTDWSHNTNASNNLWGGGSNWTTVVGRSSAPIHSDNWLFSGNNPCPDGWRVPSRFDWFDMGRGDGLGPTAMEPGFIFLPRTGTNNDNEWMIGHETRAGALGGIIVRNTTTYAAIILPAAGMRSRSDGVRNNPDGGFFWSSTQYNDTFSVFGLHFADIANNQASAGVGNRLARANGASVRCVVNIE